MREIKKQTTCSICGGPIPPGPKLKYCSPECKKEGRRRKALEWEKTHRKKPSVNKRRNGYRALAAAVVSLAIDDIKACSRNEILRYEDIGYRTRAESLPGKFKRYMDAKAFLLGKRITGITELSGPDMYLEILHDKGLDYDGKRVFTRI